MGIEIKPQKVSGAWNEGYTLDRHTLSSVMTGYNAYGHPEFDTKRSPIGELVYRLKYKSDSESIEPLAQTAKEFLDTWDIHPDLVVPVPPSNVMRRNQPVIEIARRFSALSKLKLCESCLTKVKSTAQLKDKTDLVEKLEELKNAFEVSAKDVAGKRVLIFDDLYDSGATMNTIAKELVKAGAHAVYVLALTRTRG